MVPDIVFAMLLGFVSGAGVALGVVALVGC